MHNPDSEDQLVEQPAIALLASLGWETLDCFSEFNQGSSPLGRENKGEVVLTRRLRTALEQLNPDASDEAIDGAIEELTRSRAAMSLPEANCEIYTLLKDGVKVTVTAPDDEGETVEDLKVIDWENPENNDFFLTSQFSITGEMYTRRPDAIGFINGLPLVLMEFKRIDENVYAAYHGNLRDYLDTIPHLFWYNALIILSNGSDSRVGSLTASWEHFAEWKRIGNEKEQGTVLLDTTLRGVCDHRRLLDMVENFTLFTEGQGSLVKIFAKNHQYLGVNNAIEKLSHIESNQGKLGVFWHTQGSGKSISMIFFAQKVLRTMPGNWTFVIVTDRKELDNQIYKNFADCRGVVAQQEVHAERVEHLRQLLSEDHRYIFTLIQKFQTKEGEKHPVLSDRSDIIVITDESHRSQYHTFALNMRTALPNAAFIAFTGTPLITGEKEKTREVFGDYVSTYDFKQSVEDGATVPLYYENRVPKVQLTNEQLNEEFEGILEEAELDEAQENRIQREFARQYQLITLDERLEDVARDIVSHFMGRGYRGKAIVISIDKATAVKTYDKVQKYWRYHLEGLKITLQRTTEAEEREPLQARIRYMEETDMAVVVSQSQNEIDDLKTKGADILPHRKRMNDEDLDTKFKDPNDPFRIVFVCAMWMTGFDVPSCSTIYLDKPQRNHTLMQTIARANRVFGDKANGLIVDYIGIFRDLERALAIYAEGTDPEGSNPIRNKSELVEQLRSEIAKTKEFCLNLDADLSKIEEAEPKTFERLQGIEDAVDGILINDETKQDYLQRANHIFKLYRAILPDAAANEFRGICSLINIIAQRIRTLIPSVDPSDVREEIANLLDRSIMPTGDITGATGGYETDQMIDLSQIDSDRLRERFRTQHKRIEVEKLRGTINRRLSQMIRFNKTRMDYQEKFEQMIAEYNAGSTDITLIEEKLQVLIEELNAEEGRTSAEQLSEEELTVFDLLTRPALPEHELTEEERDEVKAVSKKLLDTLKQGKLVLDWRKRQQSLAAVRITIDEILDELPECYTPQIYTQKCEAVYHHIYDSYYGDGSSIYEVAA